MGAGGIRDGRGVRRFVGAREDALARLVDGPARALHQDIARHERLERLDLRGVHEFFHLRQLPQRGGVGCF